MLFCCRAEVKLLRSPGVYGEVRVSWQIIKRDLSTFLQTSGDVVFEDMQAEAIITVQVDSNLHKPNYSHLPLDIVYHIYIYVY